MERRRAGDSGEWSQLSDLNRRPTVYKTDFLARDGTALGHFCDSIFVSGVEGRLLQPVGIA
jgi:hypothetical protein